MRDPASRPLRVLLVDDNPDDRALALRELRRGLPDVEAAEVSRADTLALALDGGDFDVVITDYQLRWTDGLAVLRAVKARRPDCPVIMLTGTGSEEVAVEAIKAGLDDYALKGPRHLVRLPTTVRTALERARQREAMREAEARYRSLFDGMPVGLFRSTPDSRILDANPAFVALLGYPDIPTLRSVNARDLYVDPTERGRIQGVIEREGVLRAFEVRLRRRDGSTIWTEESVRAVRDAAGRVLHFEGSLKDITERKRAEEALRARARQQAAIAELGQRALAGAGRAELMDEAVILVAESLDLEYAEILELTPVGDTLLLRAGVGWRDGRVGHATVGTGTGSQAGYTLQAAEPVVVEDLRRETRFSGPTLLLDHGVVSGLSVVIPGRDGPFGVLGAHTASRRSFTADDANFLRGVANLLATAVDRKRTGRALREVEELFRRAFDDSAVGIALQNLGGRYLRVNPAFCALLGYAERELLGRNFADLTHPDDREVEREGDRRMLVGEIASAQWEKRYVRKDGQVVWVLATVSLIRDAAARPVRFLVQAQDLTERKRAEDALRQSEKLATMGQLLAGVAHELNNPLAVVRGQAEILRRKGASGELATRIEQIARAAERCVRIVGNFLALARQRPPERSEVRLNDIVEEAVALVAYALRVDDVAVTRELATDLPTLWADPHQLHQVVINLVTNAHHAMRRTPPPRRLTVTSRFDRARDRVVLEVADTGPGIPPDIRERIFEPFFTTKPPGEGTGLGLALCQGIAESHGGTIEVESATGQGAMFRVELPVGGRPPVETEAAADATPRISPRTILVVDDEPEVGSLLAELLQEDGHHVDTAPNGAVALDKLRERAYDLIMTDLRMPVLDGAGLFREVERRHPALVRRIVFVTGDTLSPEATRFLEGSGALTLSKPFVLSEVRQVVERTLRGA